MMPEFSRPVTLEAARRTSQPIELVASAAERTALAARFDLIAIDRLEATLTLSTDAAKVHIDGQLRAAVTQSCVASGEAVPAEVVAPIALVAVPADQLEAAEADAEVELDGADLDIIGYDKGSIDLGELVAESLSLALDPFPRHPDADSFLKKRGVLSDDAITPPAGPFAALAGLNQPKR